MTLLDDSATMRSVRRGAQQLWSAVVSTMAVPARSSYGLRIASGALPRRYTMVRFLIIATLTFIVMSPAKASPLPSDQWTPSARLVLAQACVAESGWDTALTRECAAIAHLLARRWRLLHETRPRLTFEGLVRQYSSPIRERRRPWLLRLNAEATRPRGYSERRWERLEPQWRAVLAFVDRWQAGDEADPCPGSDHFGSVQDGAPTRWRRVQCRPVMRNRYWQIPRRR